MEEEPVLLDEELVHPPLEMMNVFRRRKWGDSITSLLAAMYISLRRYPTMMSKNQICAIARRFCNHAIEDDYRNRRRGAWSSMKNELVEKYNFVESRRTGPTFYSPVEFNLTRRGIEFCYALFTRKFHPTLATCPIAIVCLHATVREDGTVIPHRDQRPEEDEEIRPEVDLDENWMNQEEEELGVGWGNNFGQPKIHHHQPLGSAVRDLGFGNFENDSMREIEDQEMIRAIRVSRFEQLHKVKTEQSKVPPPKSEKKNPPPSPYPQKDLRALEDEQLSLAIAMSIESSSRTTDNKISDDLVIDICSQQSYHEPETIILLSQPSPEHKPNKRTRDTFETPLKSSLPKEQPTPVISLVDDFDETERGRKRARGNNNSSVNISNPLVAELDDGYFDLSEIIELETESVRNGSFHVTTDPISGSVLDLTCSPTHSQSDDDARSISSEGSNPSFSPLFHSKNPTKRRLSSASQSSISLWKRASVQVDLTSSATNNSHILADRTNLLPQTDLICTVYVDRRERKDQANYRMFFLGIERHMKSLFPEHHLLEQNLLIGDFLFMKSTNTSGLCDENKGNNQVLFNHVIERKTISDIISRSLGEKRKHWPFEGAHIRQLRYMQYCGLESSFVLLEGSITGLAATQAPLVRYIGQTGPDMIASSFDIMVFVTNMIAGGWGKHRTHILQSNDEVKTAHLLAAISYLFMNHPQRSPESLPYSSINWQIKKEEQSFYQDLIGLDLEPEFVARVVRKFSTRQALKEAYDIALKSSEDHALHLLDDIQPNVSLSGRQTILNSDSGEYDEDSEDESDNTLSHNPERSIHLHRQSEKVFCFVNNLSERKSHVFRGQTERKTTLVMNPSMKSILSLPDVEGQSSTFGDFIEIQVEGETSGNVTPLEILDVSWVTATVRTANGTRQSAPVQICVLSGDILMESLIKAERMLESTCPVTENSSNMALFNHFYAVIDLAVTNYLQSMIPNMSFASQTDIRTINSPRQVLILDNFGPLIANSGAFYRLQTELNKLQHESRYSSSSSTFSIRKGRSPLNISAGKTIQLHFLKIIYPLLICYLNICQRCYVIESRNSKDCEKWLSFLFTSIHLHSLLLY